VIDTGKAASMVISEGAEDIIQLKGAKLQKPMKPFIVIPTTAGTGSEVTYVAMNIFLSHGLEFNMSVAENTIGEMLLPLEGPDLFVQTPKEKRAEKTVACIREFQDELYRLTNLPRTLKEAGVKKDALQTVAQKSVKDVAAHFNPKKITYEDAFALLEKAY
jgi:alcohol dehydrogenase class IV